MELTSGAKHFPFLALPAELRLLIFDYVLEHYKKKDSLFNLIYPLGHILKDTQRGLFPLSYPSGTPLNPNLGSRCLTTLLTCRQFYQDFSRPAFSAAQFLITDQYSSIPRRLASLQPYQLTSIRHLTFVAGNRAIFEDMIHWKEYPFNLEDLKLESLTVAIQRSANRFWARDDTADQLVELLKRLRNVKTFSVAKNGADTRTLSFDGWYRAIVWRLLSDEQRRAYVAQTPQQEMERWVGSFSHEFQSFCLVVREGR